MTTNILKQYLEERLALLILLRQQQSVFSSDWDSYDARAEEIRQILQWLKSEEN